MWKLNSSSVVIIAGPTASGKSALALRLANVLGGEIINADSMQCYKDLGLLTASPSWADYEACLHHLYQIQEANCTHSVGWWRNLAIEQCQRTLSRHKVPIIVGGTGLYLAALEKGLSPIPTIPAAIRRNLMDRLKEGGLALLYQELHQRDPLTASRLSCHDKQRILRALEVFYGTQKPLSAWHQVTPTATPPFIFKKILLSYPRPLLMHFAHMRWQKMKENGVINEVEKWLAKKLPLENFLYKAVGLKQIKEFLENNKSETWLDEAVLTATRRYIKRQQTWFAHQFFPDVCLIDPNQQEVLFDNICL